MNDSPGGGAASRAAAHNRLAVSMIAGVLALSAGLCGCISVLPKTAPVQLYTFGERPPSASLPASRAPSPQPRVALVVTAVTLPRAAAGDQILTVTGQEAAYVAGARWLTPAVLMFQADAERALQAQAKRVRLLARSDYGAAQALLRLDVDDFETLYDQDRGAAPAILVSVRATLSRPDGAVLADETFTARDGAAENRVGAIVDAYDHATSQVLNQVAAWIDIQATAMGTTTTTETRSTGVQP